MLSKKGKSLSDLTCAIFFVDEQFAASSVDAERAFSQGRLEINHLQHNTLPQTFKAQIAVGSWCKTPLYEGISSVTQIIERDMQRRRDNTVAAPETDSDAEPESPEIDRMMQSLDLDS